MPVCFAVSEKMCQGFPVDESIKKSRSASHGIFNLNPFEFLSPLNAASYRFGLGSGYCFAGKQFI